MVACASALLPARADAQSWSPGDGTTAGTEVVPAEPSTSEAALGPVGASPLAQEPVSTLNDNGAWSWFQGERAIITASGDLLVGSTPSGTGTSGATRGGAVEVTTADASTLAVERIDRLAHAGRYRSDDHVAPGLLELPSGRVVASWAGHNDDRLKHSATLDTVDVGWTVNAPSTRGLGTTYSNLVDLPAENGGRGRLYDFYRSESQAVNALVSDDGGRTWRYGGILVKNPPLYPYIRFASNGVDRIDFVATTGNPQSVWGSSVRAGYLSGGVIHATDGTPLGTLGTGVEWSQLLPVASGVPADIEGPDVDVWVSDMAVLEGNPVALLTVKRSGSPSVEGRQYHQEYLFARWDGAAWTTSRIGWGGSELYSGQPSYSGNLTFDQRDPRRVFLSSNVDPRSGDELRSQADGRSHWEVYEARSDGAGGPWEITSITADSTVDNLRPVHVSGHGRSALVWLRGTYTTYSDYDLDVVGVADQRAATEPTDAAPRTRIARTVKVGVGRWTGTASAGVFVVASNLDGSGFLLPAGRGQARTFIDVPLTKRYAPVAFDPDGDGRDSVLLVDPDGGGTHQVVSYGAGDVEVSTLVGPAGAGPLVGDFDGDGRDDVLWYAPGPSADRLDLASGLQRRVSVGGRYRPVVGDFDGDGRDDVAWYASGGAADYVWFGGASGWFTSVRVSVSGSYVPLVLDVDGDGRDDVVWQSGDIRRRSYLWTSAGRRFTSSLWASATTLAVAGDFDGDGRDDLLFDRSGDLPDSWWWSAGAG